MPEVITKMYLMQLDEFVFPITPSKITQTMKSNNETVTLINEGEVSYCKSPSLIEFNISDLILPRYNYPFAAVGKSGTPEAYVEQLRAYQTAKRLLLLRLQENRLTVLLIAITKAKAIRLLLKISR